MDRPTGVRNRRCLRLERALWCFAACLLAVAPVAAQVATPFDSGSTGVNGSFPPSPLPSGTSYVVVNMSSGLVRYCSVYDTTGRPETCTSELGTAQIPGIPQGGLTNGVFNFTDVDLGSPTFYWLYVYFVGNAYNSPVTILSQNTITLANLVQLILNGTNGTNVAIGLQEPISLVGGRPGPGGFAGGSSGFSSTPPADGNPGFGPAGGAGGVVGGFCYGGTLSIGSVAGVSPLSPNLASVLGGSGGGGGALSTDTACGLGKGNGAGGGGGGGAILMAATREINFGSSVTIDVRGGNGGVSQCVCLSGGGGAGGSVKLVAPIIVSPYTQVLLTGGYTYNPWLGYQYAPGGIFRLEGDATDFVPSLSGQSSATIALTPSPVTPPTTPTLRITALDNMTVPAAATGNVATPDVSFATPPSGPVAVTLSASHIPIGTMAKIRVTPQVGAFTEVMTTSFSGTTESSTATASVTIPGGYGTITASATFSCSDTICALLPRQDRATAVVEVVASATGSRAFIVTKEGRRIALGD